MPDIILSKDLVQSLINSADAFPVDFDDAWEWLGYARKENGLRSLKKYFYSGQDFNLLQVEGVQNEGGRQVSRKVDKYFLTVECFKELGMLAQTEQGKLVRKYYLECERIVQTVIPAQNDRIRELELETKLLELKGSMVSLHGKELALRLMGDTSAIVNIETTVTEVVGPETNRSTKILSADQLKKEVKKRTGQNLKSMKQFTDALMSSGRDDLLVAVTRNATALYVPPGRLDEALGIVYGAERQSLIGEN
jgi:phage anti-repressor protein